MHRSLVAVALLLGTCAVLALGLDVRPGPAPVKSAGQTRLLPGVQSNGAILLPNQWSLRPAGKQLTLGDFPVNAALHPSGQWLAILHAGYGEHEVVIVDLNPPSVSPPKVGGRYRGGISCRVPLEQAFYGLCFSPDGRQLFASGAEHEVIHAFGFEDGLLS